MNVLSVFSHISTKSYISIAVGRSVPQELCILIIHFNIERQNISKIQNNNIIYIL